MGKSGQTEINLKDDLPERDRADLYKTYLLFCLTGEVIKVPFGGQITTKKDDSEYVFLNQLGGILGFRQQAEIILADGHLTKARVEQLNDLQKKMGLPPEYAQKTIKSITTTKMAAAIETAVTRGRLTIKQIRELKEASVFVEKGKKNKREPPALKHTCQVSPKETKETPDDESVSVAFHAHALAICNMAFFSVENSSKVAKEKGAQGNVGRHHIMVHRETLCPK
ncbi:hypothetical protein L6164_028730 [Bauhinia variegata]|uniref:Uncharacterized protein n=2 Tax=Bauhinia variegata TaxID=167791 RepID=A0ACB9L7I2_BAUVA|nr:hypothetical protein L6164_028725 [Bauhinia variegata]KAI4305359.1 hypothetical protein L6164_028730 [Bauhinia variegata]